MDDTCVATSELTDQQRAVFADVLSQAITGELIGMANYAAMVRLFPQPDDQRDMLLAAASELGHSERFRRAARELGVTPIVNLEAPYWLRIRKSFLRHVDANDPIACLAIQEVMLESFAYSMYHAVADVAHEQLARVFRAIGVEEDAHGDHAVEVLKKELGANREAFEHKLEQLHNEVMSTLAEMMAAKDSVEHCGLCHGECVKGNLQLVGLDRATLRGLALNRYLRTLDRIGVRGELSLSWVARLPV